MELKTDRLYIRSLREADRAKMKELLVDFAKSPYSVYDRPLPTEAAAVNALIKQFVGSGLFFAVFAANTDQMIGYVCFHKNGEAYDLGYCFNSAFHSKGYAYESAKALIEHFIKKYDVTSFTAGTALDNLPSCRLLNKLGFTCISTETVSFDGVFSFNGSNFVLNVR
ncbi:MAG: GNAT family N-acetyltransferase [Ruminococcus sp.]|nr:GNAT family N-acetyltransferase [Ruminococcus sp.]